MYSTRRLFRVHYGDEVRYADVGAGEVCVRGVGIDLYDARMDRRPIYDGGRLVTSNLSY